MRKTILAIIAAGALTMTACTTTDMTIPGTAGDREIQGPVGDATAAAEQLDELLLSSLGVSDWEEATEGWGRDVTGTDINGTVFLVHTTYRVNDGDRSDDAELIGEEVIRLIAGDPAAQELGQVNVTYGDGRGAYFRQL